ncbi:glutamate synthase large subunit [Acidaminobacter sp. JC074]|uniref:glutamate synthase large subunit n=1 Tax=Acidaminobacter sp. JC074 TaxID=2530199 RepID=UPI001F117CAB|nr:glutamate synthase large subunit [Acidaminobacter sp. JC074]MCH4886859.1 glutamate synthase large subunit [Acidaminobacter sp. JC074]
MDLNDQCPNRQGLYDPVYEKGSCGVGFIADVNGVATHKIVEDGLQILKNMAHRGATGADPETGDGAGLMIQLPHDYFSSALKEEGISLPQVGDYGVGMLFLPLQPGDRYRCEGICERIIHDQGHDIITWRNVEVNEKVCGHSARGTRPIIKQVFISSDGLDEDKFKQTLYIIRKRIENEIRELEIDNFFICSLSTRTIVYKGLLLAHQIEGFYPELNKSDVTSSIAVVHQRYSTNTFPSWKLAHPYRYVSHNGEINTIKGNVKWMAAREGEMTSKVYHEDLDMLLPLTDISASDSYNFDSVFEFLLMNGYSAGHALKMLMPEAWRYDRTMPLALRSFYEYHEGMLEAWDGPATIVYSDGIQVGVSLDRNGLRPARYLITEDNQLIVASEAGVLKIDENRVKAKGKLGPGQILIADTNKHTIEFDETVKSNLITCNDYASWIERNKVDLDKIESSEDLMYSQEDLLKKQKLYAYSEEELRRVIAPMAESGKEAVSSMGNDVPLAVLSDEAELMFNYFRQMFAQVTNPPIDPIREKKVMSLNQYLGRSGDILKAFYDQGDAPYIELEQPILYDEKMSKIRTIGMDSLRSIDVPMVFSKDQNLKEALALMLDRVEAAAESGYRIVILSDRSADRYNVPIPSILGVSAVHNHLIKKKLRTKVDIIVETAEARDAFHMALLIGYGATAVYPYLAFMSIKQLVKSNLYLDISSEKKACMNYVRSLGYGIRKITSKMGISTLRSFNGAQIFEILGLNKDLVDDYFTDSIYRLSGISLDIIMEESLIRHRKAYGQKDYKGLDVGGKIHWRKGESVHLLEPEVIADLQHACKTDDYDLYKTFADRVNDQSRQLKTIRGLFKFKDRLPIDIGQVESVDEIVKRFATGAMSFGSLSKEVHETLAIAMNKLGGKSNSGEGGEDPSRYKPSENGDNKRSSIKQVAAGRFGVDTEYLTQAEELQIKVAQGAKPGEGGHLPGKKVTEAIAKVRHALPGIDLISPPPHHDIYSIEDLEQLIFDLKNVNSEARVSVKLVSEAGVGTIAAGVAKGAADMVLISGHDGGTGAAPLTSLKTAGVPWEIGLSETHQTLLLNNLRSRIAVQVDGQLRTGRDVAIGAILGAEEFGFATAPLIVCGCIMMRKCHNNTCPVGVATQDPELRKNFRGKPEHVINYFRFIAEELREIMAELGIRKLDDMIGRTELLEMNQSLLSWKHKNLDLNDILYKPDLPERFGRRKLIDQVDPTLDVMDKMLIVRAGKSFKDCLPTRLQTSICNVDRSVGAILSSQVVKNFGAKGLEEDTIYISFYGTSGQSFGAFLAPGITFELEGETNDYVGKSLSGGKLIIKPSRLSKLEASDNIIAGNTLLYGATSGQAYIAGKAGERFCVRNSGADAVVEGIGDHGCEYMTGGHVAILGPVGRNFAAGMSGGTAYILDDQNNLDKKCNQELVSISNLTSYDYKVLKDLIEKHVEYTSSKKAAALLADWHQTRHRFKKVVNPSYESLIMKSRTERCVG